MPNNSTAIQPDDLILQSTISRLAEFKVTINEVILANNKLEKATIALAKSTNDKETSKNKLALEKIESRRNSLLRALNAEMKKNGEISIEHIKNNNNLKKALERINAEIIKQKDTHKKATKEYIQNEKDKIAQLKKEEAELKKQEALLEKNRKNSKTFFDYLKKGATAALGFFGVTEGLSFVKEKLYSAFETMKTLDSLSLSLDTIVEGEEKQIRTLGFLKQISNSYGADIVKLTENYIRFVAASKESGFTLRQTEKIYGSITKAMSVLGKNEYELESSLLAVEQMMSKGKVTTEELRRQLGERLPGAMAIMAKAAGVTVEELDKMMRNGEVMSKDVLPKFADALEETYGIENVNKVNTLTAAQTRNTNAWIDFVRTVKENKGVLTDALVFILNLTSGIAEGLGKWFGGKSNSMRFSSSYNAGYEVGVNDIREGARKEQLTEEEYAKKYLSAQEKIVAQEKSNMDNLRGSYTSLTAEIEKLTALRKTGTLGFSEDLKAYNRIREVKKQIGNLDENAVKAGEDYNMARGYLAAFNDTLEKQTEIIAGHTKTEDDKKAEKINYFEGKDLLTFNEKLIALLKEEKQAYDDIYKAEKSSLEQKLGALNAIQSVESDLAKLERDNEILKLDTNYKNDIEQYNEAIFKSEDEKLAYKQKLEDYYQYYREVAEENYQIKLREFEAEKNENSIKALEEYYKNELELVKNKYDETENYHIEALDKLYADGLITTEEYENNKKELTLKYLTESVNAQIEVLKKLYEFYNSIGDEKMVSEIGAKIAELYNQLTDLPDNLKENKDKLKDFLKEVKDYAEKIYDSIAELVNTIYDANISRLEGMKDKMEEYYDKQYELAEGDAEQQRLIQLEKEKEERKINARIRKEKIKQAQAEKIFAALKIQIDTAAAVIGFLNNPGGVYGLALSIMAGTLGAINLGRVAAAKIPEYKYGTENHKGGVAYVGDGGVREVIEDGNKTWITPSEKTLVYLNKGAKVYSSEDKYKVALRKSRLRNETSHTTTSNQQNHPNYSKDIKNGFKGVKLIVINNIEDYKTKNTQF